MITNDQFGLMARKQVGETIESLNAFASECGVSDFDIRTSIATALLIGAALLVADGDKGAFETAADRAFDLAKKKIDALTSPMN